MTSVENKKQLPAFLVLTIISLVAAVVLAATNMVTRGPIAEHARQARLKAFGAVLPAADYVEVTIPEGHPNVTGLYEAVDENGNVLGHTVVAATGGYGGPVAVTLGIGMDGMVTGAVVGDTSFAETPDIGDKWKRQPDRWEQFKSIDTANGGSVEAISGATITSGAVLASTNAAINCVNEVRGVEARNVVKQGAPAAPVVEQVALTGGIHEGSAAGYQSDVQVQLTMDDAGVITGLNINALGETNGLGTRASTESSFAEQFVGKSAPFTLGDGIDALAGATVTSTAVVEAVNAACASPVNPDAVPFDLGGGKEEEPAVETSATPAEPAPAGAWVGTAPGFNDYGMGGDVSVTATLNEDGTIATLTVDVTTQTPGIGDKCADEAWLAQFIGKAAPFTAGENGIDVIAGSTMTSNGIINALNNMAEAPAAEEAAPADGLTATAPGFNDYGMGGDVSVTVTLNEDGTIATLDVDLDTQTPGIGDKCADAAWLSQFIGKAGPFVAGENGIDVISGSTMTSNGIINALNTLFPAEAPVEETPAEEEAPAGLTATAPGFNDYGMGGDVSVTVTLNEDGTIATLDVDLVTQTPGIGDKCADAAWLGQFIGKAGPFVAGENGIDVISGSTMTSNGIINALNTLFPAEAPVEETPAEEVPAEEEAPAGLTATAPGFNDYGMGGDVSVTVTLNEDGTIATLDVDLTTQTPGIGDKCADAAWLGQFIGKAGPFVAGENGIDVISGSTMTSNGIINALNTLFPAEAPVEETPAEEVPTEEEAPAGLTATAPGFNDYGMGGDVSVTVTLNEDGTIATLDVDLATQTPGIGDKCADATWLGQFIGKAGPFVAGENGIDVISGSTMTSNGIINALNTLFTAEAPVEETPAEEVPAEEEAPAGLTATAPGFNDYGMGGDVGVTVTLNEDGTIATLDVDLATQTPGIGDKCADAAWLGQFVGKAGPFVAGENGIDVISGSTMTSNGIINALNTLFPAEAPAEEVPAEEEAPAGLTATAPGFNDYGMGGDVSVTVTLNEDGTIATLDVDLATQTPGIGDKCADAAWLGQFIGKAGPFVAGENGIDVISGSTMTSNGIINALNTLFTAEEAPVEEAPAA